MLNTAGTGTTSYGFTGEWTDGTGLINLRARYMNTGVGRFMSRDIWAGDYNRPLSLNRWNYVEGNPINRVDPNGQFAEDYNIPDPCNEEEEYCGDPFSDENTPGQSTSPADYEAWLLYTRAFLSAARPTEANLSRLDTINIQLRGYDISMGYCDELANTAIGTSVHAVAMRFTQSGYELGVEAFDNLDGFLKDIAIQERLKKYEYNVPNNIEGDGPHAVDKHGPNGSMAKLREQSLISNKTQSKYKYWDQMERSIDHAVNSREFTEMRSAGRPGFYPHKGPGADYDGFYKGVRTTGVSDHTKVVLWTDGFGLIGLITAYPVAP